MLVEFTQHDQKDPVTPKAVIITAENAYADIGPNVLSVEKRFEGGYVFPLNELNPSGEWKLQITAQREEGYDVNAAFTIEYPSAIEATKHTDDVRRFDDFAVIVLSVGSAGTLIALFLITAALHAVRFKRENVTVGVAPVSISQSLFIGSIGIGVIGVVLATGWSFFGESDLKKMCEADGHQFVQAFPTRDFEATSPNAQNGCLVHDGHFHFIDEREYTTWKKEWK
jgi:hypothetical protein